MQADMSIDRDSALTLTVARIDCNLHRVVGLILVIVSSWTLIGTVRYLTNRCSCKRNKKRLSPVILSMIISSLPIILLAVPLLFIQSLTCRPMQSNEIICQMQAFVCFAIGVFNMYLMALLSFFRYLNVLHQTSSLNRLIKNRRYLIIVLCALLSCAWSIPPLFNVGNAYVNDELGFHCSLDWTNRTFRNRFYLGLLFTFVYLIPLILLLWWNIHVYVTLRQLIHRSLSPQRSLSTSSPPRVNLSNCSFYLMGNLDTCYADFRKRASEIVLSRTASHLRRLRIDRCYARATAILVAQYLLAWTPYASLALLRMNGQFIYDFKKQPAVLPICALMAKLTLILSPLIYIYAIRLQRYDLKRACICRKH